MLLLLLHAEWHQFLLLFFRVSSQLVCSPVPTVSSCLCCFLNLQHSATCLQHWTQQHHFGLATSWNTRILLAVTVSVCPAFLLKALMMFSARSRAWTQFVACCGRSKLVLRDSIRATWHGTTWYWQLQLLAFTPCKCPPPTRVQTPLCCRNSPASNTPNCSSSHLS